jgi:type II secretory pathway component PulJ
MKRKQFHKQSGASLMEVLVAMSISLVVTAAMIAMMSNTLGTTARIINMTKLQDDMRVAMQMMTRDVRRSSYNAFSELCYANHDCGDDSSGLTLAGDIVINEAKSCFTFLMDRDHDGDSTEDAAGGFRHVFVDDVGVIEMWTGDNSPNCGDDAGAPGWVQITNPENMDIFAFSVEDRLTADGKKLSYTEVILDNGTDKVEQKVRKLQLDMQGQLVLDNSIQRHIVDIIDVRNDLLL